MDSHKDDFGRSDFDYGSFVGSVTERFNSIDSKFQNIVDGMSRIELKQDAQVVRMDVGVKQFFELVNECKTCEKEENIKRDEKIASLEQRQVFIAGGLSVLMVVLTLAKDAILKLL